MAHGTVCTINGSTQILLCNVHILDTLDGIFDLTLTYHNGKRTLNKSVLTFITSIFSSEYVVVSQKFSFSLYSRYGDLALLEFMSKKRRTPSSPPIRAAKFATFDIPHVKLEANLIGCDLCGIKNDTVMQEVGTTSYYINTFKGHCGRPLVHFSKEDDVHYIYGIHRFGSKTPGGANAYEPFPISGSLSSLYKPYMLDTEGIKLVYKLDGRPSIVKTNFISDPMSHLIPKEWIDKNAYELKEMSVQGTIEGNLKYNRYENWDIFEHEHWLEVYELWSQKWAGICEKMSTPQGYEDWHHVMIFGGQDQKKHSSPGYPFNKDDYDKVTWLDHKGKELWAAINDRSVLKLPCIATNSAKDEVRAKAKAQRMFAAMPIHHTGVGVFLFAGMMMKAKEDRLNVHNCFSYGLSLDEMSIVFKKMFGKSNLGHSWDVDGCDTSIPSSALHLIFSFLRQYIDADKHDLFDWFAKNVIYTFLKNPDNSVWMKDMGNPSGNFLTTLINSMWSSLVFIMTYVRVIRLHKVAFDIYNTNKIAFLRNHVIDKYTGDDTITAIQHAPFFTKEEIKKCLPIHVSITFDDPDNAVSNVTTVTFLSLKVTVNLLSRYRNVQYPMVHSKPERMLMKMLYKHVTHNHEIFYQKVCNALGYMLFDSVWHERLTSLKQACERFFSDNSLSYVHISLHDLEIIRGVMYEESTIYDEQSGNVLNTSSHFINMHKRQVTVVPVNNNNNNNNNQPKKRKKGKPAMVPGNVQGVVIAKKNGGASVKVSRIPKQVMVVNPKSFPVPANKHIEKYVNTLPPSIIRALDCIINADTSKKFYPAPVATGSRFISTNKYESLKMSLPNFATGLKSFKSLMIEEKRVDCPFLNTRTTSSDYDIVVGNSPGTNDIRKGLTVVAQSPGYQWGITRNIQAIERGAICSFNPSSYGITAGPGHGWAFCSGTVAAATYAFYVTVDGTSDLTVTLWRTKNEDMSGLAVVATVNTVAQVPNTPFVSNIAGPEDGTFNYYFLTVFNNVKDGRKVNVICKLRNVTGTYDEGIKFWWPRTGSASGLATQYKIGVFNMESNQYNNYTDLIAESDQFRINGWLGVWSNSVQEFLKGGTAVQAAICSNDEWSNDWLTYMNVQPGTRVAPWGGDDENQGTSTFNLPVGEEFKFSTLANQPINPFTGENLRVNVVWITFNNLADGNLDALDVAYRMYGVIDYITKNMLIPKYQVVPLNDQWVTLCGYIMMMYHFTDNPNHKDVLRVISNAAKWMMGDTPAATAIRRSVKEVGTMAAKMAGQQLIKTLGMM